MNNVNDVNSTSSDEIVWQEMLQDVCQDLTRMKNSIRKQDDYSPIENIFRMAFQILANQQEYKVKKCKMRTIAIA